MCNVQIICETCERTSEQVQEETKLSLRKKVKEKLTLFKMYKTFHPHERRERGRGIGGEEARVLYRGKC